MGGRLRPCAGAQRAPSLPHVGLWEDTAPIRSDQSHRGEGRQRRELPICWLEFCFSSAGTQRVRICQVPRQVKGSGEEGLTCKQIGAQGLGFPRERRSAVGWGSGHLRLTLWALIAGWGGPCSAVPFAPGTFLLAQLFCAGGVKLESAQLLTLCPLMVSENRLH